MTPGERLAKILLAPSFDSKEAEALKDDIKKFFQDRCPGIHVTDIHIGGLDGKDKKGSGQEPINEVEGRCKETDTQEKGRPEKPVESTIDLVREDRRSEAG